MKRVRALSSAALLAAAVSLAACGDSTAPKLNPVTVDSILVELAETQAFGAAAGIFTGGFAAAAMPAGACPYNAANQRFVCAPVTAEGITTNRYYQLLDASGTPQSAFDRATTEAFHTVADVEGAISVEIPEEEGIPAGTLTITIDSHDEQTLSGLFAPNHVLNGTSTSDVSIDFGGEVLAASIVSTTSNLVLPRRGTSQKYPLSGSIASTITRDGETTSVTMTFNGTSKVTMTMSFGGLTQTCVFDLDDPEAEPVCG